MKRTIAALSLIVAVCWMVAALPAPAMAADRTVTLTLTCNGGCTGGWGWYQGGTSGTQLGGGSINGVDTTTTGTTIQPATADTVIIDLSVSGGSCGTSQTESFSPGSSINFTVKLNVKPGGYNNFGCKDSFNMKS